MVIWLKHRNVNLRKKLIVNSTLIFGLVYTVSALLIYMVYYRNSEQIIFNELESTSLLTAYFYLEEDELSRKEHNKIKEQFMGKIQNSKVKLYNERNEFSFGDQYTGFEQFLTADILDRTRKLGKYKFKIDNNYFYGIYYPDNQGNFVVYVITENVFFESQSRQLIYILTGSLVLGLLLILLFSRYLSKIAYQSITKIANQIDSIDIYSKDADYLALPETNDEVQKMVLKFNELLKGMAENFNIQKNFINYLSHEIKTPLTAISGNLEVFGQKNRNPEEYKTLSRNALKNVYEIKNIIKNLLILSGLEKTESKPSQFRIDELTWKVCDKIISHYPEAKQLIKIDIQIDQSELFQVYGSDNQLEIAIYNLIENAVKYSNQKPIQIEFSEVENHLQLIIQDHGKGIPEDELKFISEPFQRGSNVLSTKGSGIGLSLALLILEQNQIGFSIQSKINEGTTIRLKFKT